MTFSEYQEAAISTAIYPQEHSIIYPALKLAGEAGEVAEKVGKVLRDSGGAFTDEKRRELAKEIGDVLWYCAAISRDLGLNLDDVATANIAKLRSRQERGVLQGSGDNR
jgi:NTP pyrophosphatase (non-canonical NTP hydrolase)